MLSTRKFYDRNVCIKIFLPFLGCIVSRTEKGAVRALQLHEGDAEMLRIAWYDHLQLDDFYWASSSQRLSILCGLKIHGRIANLLFCEEGAQLKGNISYGAQCRRPTNCRGRCKWCKLVARSFTSISRYLIRRSPTRMQNRYRRNRPKWFTWISKGGHAMPELEGIAVRPRSARVAFDNLHSLAWNSDCEWLSIGINLSATMEKCAETTPKPTQSNE